MNINKESEIFKPSGIAKIEELKDATFVCETCVRMNTGNPDAPWSNQAVAVFYNKEAHPDSGSHYFGLYVNLEDKTMITNAQSAVDTPIQGIIADDGEIIYSRYRHDFRRSKDGSVFVDGGRDYMHSSLLRDDRHVTLRIVKDQLCIMEKII